MFIYMLGGDRFFITFDSPSCDATEKNADVAYEIQEHPIVEYWDDVQKVVVENEERDRTDKSKD